MQVRPMAAGWHASAPGRRRWHVRRNWPDRGYSVTIFDRNELPGGLNTYGIAAYKLRASDVAREVQMVRELGVEFKQKTEVGRDVTFTELESQFDAIFLGVGLGDTWALDLPGEDLGGVYGALEFIEKTKSLPLSRSRSDGESRASARAIRPSTWSPPRGASMPKRCM